MLQNQLFATLGTIRPTFQDLKFFFLNFRNFIHYLDSRPRMTAMHSNARQRLLFYKMNSTTKVKDSWTILIDYGKILLWEDSATIIFIIFFDKGPFKRCRLVYQISWNDMFKNSAFLGFFCWKKSCVILCTKTYTGGLKSRYRQFFSLTFFLFWPPSKRKYDTNDIPF